MNAMENKPPPPITPVLLDTMLGHVRYEIDQLIEFRRYGNGWCELLRPDIALFTNRSIVESGLIHARAIVEFLDSPKGDRVVARHYLPKQAWTWKATEELSQVKDLHGRLAHLGTIRAAGGFDWAPWLDSNVPVILRTVRKFADQLSEVDPARYRRFVGSSDQHPTVDLGVELDKFGAGK